MADHKPSLFDELFSSSRVMAILRGYPVDETLFYANRAWDLGLTVVEVPVEVPEAMPALEATIRAGHERGRKVGAGTIWSVDQLELVVRAGAAFTVAPGLDPRVMARSEQLGLAHLPGVATASEVQAALRFGATWVKVFPATVLGTGWLRAMRGPFPNLKIVATGGVDADNASALLRAGADVVAVGSALGDPAALERLAELALS